MRATSAVLPNRPSSQKSPRVPVLGYNHTLSVDEIVGRMIGYEPQEMPYHEVLDCFVEQAEMDYERAVKQGANEEELTPLKAEIDRRAQIRIHAMNLRRELNTAADEIAQGLGHPQLVSSGRAYVRGLPQFTVTSVYKWAKAVHGQEIPEWAPDPEHSLAVKQTEPRLEDSVRGVKTTGSRNGIPQKKVTAHRNLQVTTHIMARALAGMVDQLAEKDHIDPPCSESCLNEDDSINLSALWEYLGCESDLPSSAVESAAGTAGDTNFPSIDIFRKHSRCVGHGNANLADWARVEHWLRVHRRTWRRGSAAIQNRSGLLCV